MAINDAFLQKWANDLQLTGCSEPAIKKVQHSIDRTQSAMIRQKATEKRLQEWEKRYDKLLMAIKQLKHELGN